MATTGSAEGLDATEGIGAELLQAHSATSSEGAQ